MAELSEVRGQELVQGLVVLGLEAIPEIGTARGRAWGGTHDTPPEGTTTHITSQWFRQQPRFQEDTREGHPPELSGLVDELALHISWEVDPDCIQVLRKHHPEAQNRGSFLEDDPQAVADIIHHHDPSGSLIVLFVAAPPCPDFSRIREDAPGSAGVEGQKFTEYCEFARGIESKIPHKRVGYLVENVVMERGEADFFAKRLDCNTVMVDSQDLGLINRPRLWWTRIDWSRLKSSPTTGDRLKWAKSQKFYRLIQDGPQQEESHMELDGLKLHQDVAAHKARLPCLTTPAPSEGGVLRRNG